jgi:hypothetical protein
MSDTTQTRGVNGRSDGDRAHESITDPEAIADSEGLEISQRTYIHENRDHCEANAVGRAIVGITDEDGRLLLLVNPAADHAILLHATVAPGEDWATIGRHTVEEMAGISVTLDTVERVRQVDHVLDGDSTPQSTTHHLVFGASVASPEATLDGPCEDDGWEIGWYDELPVGIDDNGTGALDDIRLFLG